MKAIDSQREAWLIERRTGIGASDAAAVLGLSRWKSALELFSEKIGLSDPEFDIPEWMQWGNLLEPVIADRYAKETGYALVDPGRFTIKRSSIHNFLICTLDRVIIPNNSGNHGVLEIKNVAGYKNDEWQDEPPIEYQIQAQHQMIVSDCAWGAFAVLFGGQRFDYFPFVKNDCFCNYYIEHARAFWQRVEVGDPPEADDSTSSREALWRLYPRETGETRQLDRSLIPISQRLDGVKEAIRRLEKKEDLYKNTLMQAIGDASYGALPNGIKYSLRTISKPEHSVAACTFRQLRKMKGRKER